MAKIPVDPAGAFPTPEEAATRSETSARLHAYFDKNPAASSTPVEDSPPAGELVEKAKPGMGDLHMKEEEDEDRQDRKGIHAWESLKLDAGLNEKPGMGELRAIEERDMPHAMEVNALVKERQNLSDSDERAHEIDAKLSPSGKKAWEEEDEDPGTPQATTPFAMAARLFAPEATGSALQNYKAVQAKAKVGTGETQEENALKMYSAQEEARRFKERLAVDAGDVPIDISHSADGTIQLDTRPFKDKLILSQREVFAKEAGYAGWHDVGDEFARQKGFTQFEDAPKEVQELARQEQMDFEQKAEDWARTEITRAGQVGRHLVFVDTDPENTTKRIAAMSGIERDITAALAPEASISLTPGAKDFQPVRYGSYVWKMLNAVPAIASSRYKMYAKSDAPSMLINGDFDGLLEMTMRDATPEESLELVRLIRSDPSVAAHMAEITGELAEETANSMGYTEEQGKEVAAWARFAGGAFGFVTGDLVMPDPVTMSLSALGMGAKWAGTGLKEYKYNKTAEYLLEQANASHLEYSEFIDNIRKVDPVAANILEMRISQEFQMHTKIRAAVREAEEAAKKAAKMAEEARAKAGINAGDEPAHVAASQAEANARVAEANLAAQRRIAAQHALEQSKASRAQGQVAEKTWKDWQAAKQKATDARTALNNHVGTHAADITAHRGAQTTLTDKAVAIEKAAKDLKDAQAAKTNGIAAAKAELDAARKGLATAVADDAARAQKAGVTQAADRLQAAKSAVKATGEASHPLNVAIKDASAARAKAVAEHAAAQTEAMAQHALHGPKVEEGAKLERAATKAMDNEARLQALAKSMGVDTASGVHPTAQIEQALKNAVTGARVAEAHAMSRVKNAGDVLAHAEKTMERAIQEAETAHRATGWRDTARQMASDMQNGIKEYQKWQDAGGTVEDIVRPSIVKGAQPVVPHAPGTVVVDPLSLFTSMKKKYGEAAIDHAMTERGPFGDLLRKMFDGVDDGSAAVHDGKDVVVITQKEIELLQDHPTFMTMAVRRSGNDAPAAVLVEAMELARKFDPSIKPAGLHARLLQNAVNFYEAAFPKDVLRTAIGPTKSAVQQVIKGATNLSAQIDDEMLTIIRKARLEDLDSAIVNQVIEAFGFNPEIGKRAGKGGLSVSSVTGQLFYSAEERAITQISALVQYMDTTKGMEYVGGKTFVNTTSVETTWQIARRKMVYGDKRSREWNVAMDAWEREVAQIQIDYDEARRAYEEAGAGVAGTIPPSGPGRTLPMVQQRDGDAFFAEKALAEARDQSPKSRDILVYMSPDEFLSMAQEGRNADKAVRVEDAINTGTKLSDIPFLGFTHDGNGAATVISHEGRHRARALKQRGIKQMPVVLSSHSSGEGKAIRWGVQSPESPDFVEKMPSVLMAEEGQGKIPFPAPGRNLPSVEGDKRRQVEFITGLQRRHPNGFNARQVLEQALRIDATHAEQEIIEHLLNTAGEFLESIPVRVNRLLGETGTLGTYGMDTRSIELSPVADHVTGIHEAIHALTSHALDGAKGLSAEAQRSVKMLNKMWESLSAREGVAAHYGLTNVHEFVAEAFSNPRFQEFLKTVPTSGAPSVKARANLWDSFIDSITRLLGLKDDNLLTHVLAHGNVIIKHTGANGTGFAGDTGGKFLFSLDHVPPPPVFPPRPSLGPSEGETLSPIVAMARSWLPAFTTADANVAAGLETSAVKALRDNMQGQGSFLDMVVALRGHTARPTGIGMGEVDFSPSKAIGFAARAASHARVLATADDLMYRAIGGLLTAEQVADMNKFARGQWTEVEDFTSMMEAFNRLGQPITQMSPKKVDSAGKISDIVTHFVETGRSETGESFFMGQNLLQKIEENMPKVTKELEDRAAKAHLPEQILGVQAEQFLIAQWKKSIITGTVVPNMHYWAANVAGDFSQMWFTPGVGPFTAVKQSFQNLPANIPGIGPIFQDFMSEMSYKAQGKPVLGTLTNAFFNPYLSKFWNGGEGVVQFKSGLTVSFETLRKWAVEDGILDTFLHEELPEAFSRVTPSVWKKVVSGWSDHITQFANFAQQRQRSGLYLDLLQQGYTRDEARRLTLDALYDWKHAVAEHEISGWAKQIPFYRFFRLQQRQVFSAFADSFVKPEEAFGLALTGQSKLGAARSQATFVDLISKSKSWLNPEAQAPYADAQAQRDQMQTVLYPSWMRDRGVLGVNKLKDDYVRMLQNANGKIYTHEATTQLPLTIVDGLTMQMGILESLTAAVAGKKGQLAPDWKESFWEPSLNMLSPIVRDPLKAFLGDITSDPTGIKPGKTAKVTPGEAEVMNFLAKSGLYDKVVPNEKGELRTSTAQAFIFRLTAVVGTEVPKFMDSSAWNNAPTLLYRDKLKRAARDREMARVAETPERAAELLATAERLEGEAPDEVGAMMSWFLRKQLGVGAHPFNPEEEIGRREKSIEEAYKIISGQVEAPPFQPYLAPVEER